MKKIALIIITGLISLSLYGNGIESISNNFVEHKKTLKLSEFKYVKDHAGDNPDQKKAIYRSKETKRLWMVQENFNYLCFRQYIIGDVFRLVLGNRAPELRLIKGSRGNLMLGSEFIPKFKTLMDFFNSQASKKNAETLKNCFPTGCESKEFGGSLRISGGEDVLALMIILGEIDGHDRNLGLIPSKEEPNLYEVGKIDHEEAMHGLVDEMTLRSLAKIAFCGDTEGQEDHYTVFDYEKFDLNKIADAFDVIASIPDDMWGGTIIRRAQEMSKENIDEEVRGYVDMAEQIADQFNLRKNRCKDFAIGLRCEAAVRSDNFDAIMDLIAQGFDINTAVEYIHLDTSKEKQIASLTKLWSLATEGNTGALNYFIEYSQQNGPITVLEMAVRYNKLKLVKQLAPLSNPNSLMEATRAAFEIKNQEIGDFLATLVTTNLDETEVKKEL